MTETAGRVARPCPTARRGRRRWLSVVLGVGVAVGGATDEGASQREPEPRRVSQWERGPSFLGALEVLKGLVEGVLLPPPYKPKHVYFLRLLALSPAADRVVLVPYRHGDGTPDVPSRRLVLYDRPADTLTLLPPLEAGWFAGGVEFSRDGTRLATATTHGHLRFDRPYRSRLMLYDFPTGRWRTLIDAPTYYGGPRFVSDDRELLYSRTASKTHGETLALLNLADGRETELSLLSTDIHPRDGTFSSIFEAQFRAPNEILFLGSGPKAAHLKAHIEQLDKRRPPSVIADAFLYRVPVERPAGQVRISGPVEFLSALNTLPGLDIGFFWYLPQTRDIVFRATVRGEKGGLAEVIYVVRDGQIVASKQTRLMPMDLAPSADGQTMAFLGNPLRLVDHPWKRAEVGKDLTELFFYDVAADTIRSVALAKRVNELLHEK